MTSSAAEPIVSRKSVPLTQRDLDDLEKLRQSGTPYGRALRELLNDDYESPTEAALLHLLLRMGIDAVAERALEQGYRQLAEATTEEEHEEMRAWARLHAETWANEE